MPELWLIGTGAMALSYQQVLTALRLPFTVIGRSVESCNQFTSKSGVSALPGGIECALDTCKTAPKHAIVAVSVEALYPVCRQFLLAGVKSVLLEKPGALYPHELEDLQKLAEESQSTVVIGYNRRFYQSVQAARDILDQDGGPCSMQLELTEWSHQLSQLKLPKAVLQRWMIANTAHVIDLAFYLAGKTQILHCEKSGTLDWHPAFARIAGSGVTEQGVLFTYSGDWESAGRWGLELQTKAHRLIFRPLEQLQIQSRGQLRVENVTVKNDIDQKFKAGLYQQTLAFSKNELQNFATLSEQTALLSVICKMAGYSLQADTSPAGS